MTATERFEVIKAALDAEAVYNKVTAPGYDPSKLLGAAKGFSGWKGVPGIVARTYARTVTPDAVPSLQEKVKGVSKEKVLKFILDNAALFENARATPAVTNSKVASSLFRIARNLFRSNPGAAQSMLRMRRIPPHGLLPKVKQVPAEHLLKGLTPNHPLSSTQITDEFNALRKRLGMDKKASQTIEKDESDSKEEQAEKKKSILPWLLLGGGAGLGLAGAAMFTPKMREAMQKFTENSKSWATGEAPGKATKSYVEDSSKLLQQNLWGVLPTRKVVELARKLPWLSEKERWDPGAAEHYDSFQRGPLSGYLRLADEVTHETPLQGVAGMLTTNFNNNIRRKAEKLLKARGLKWDERNLTPEQQQQAFEALNKFDWLSPFTSLQQSIYNHGVGKSRVAEWGPIYSNKLVEPLQKVPSVLGGVGAGMGLTGAALLYRQRQKEKELAARKLAA
jgi:hypothetical protein